MPDRLRKRPPCQAHDRYRERRGRGSRVASSRPGTARWCVISVRPINTCQCPLWGAHTAFVFLRGQPPGNRNKWWRQFWRRVSDYQPVLMRRRDGRQRCHRTCEVLSSNVSARRSAFICGCSTKAMHACRVPEITELRRPATLGKRAQALRPRRDETQSRHCERL
jgi:hypothetical protein